MNTIKTSLSGIPCCYTLEKFGEARCLVTYPYRDYTNGICNIKYADIHIPSKYVKDILKFFEAGKDYLLTNHVEFIDKLSDLLSEINPTIAI